MSDTIVRMVCGSVPRGTRLQHVWGLRRYLPGYELFVNRHVDAANKHDYKQKADWTRWKISNCGSRASWPVCTGEALEEALQLSREELTALAGFPKSCPSFSLEPFCRRRSFRR